MKRLMEKLQNFDPSYLQLWVIFFLYTMAVAFAVQFVLLPYVFKQWHAGDGLLVAGDWLTYHQIAIKLADKINTQGWSAWMLRPYNHAAAGIASAVYALTVPKPWTLIPLNAALHASATLILLAIVRIFINERRKAILCVLPFFLYPSAMTWYTQILKDGYFITGMLAFIYGLMLLARPITWEQILRRALPTLALVVAGIILIWIPRPYAVKIAQYVSSVTILLLSATLVAHCLQGQFAWKRAATAIVICWLLIVAMTPLTYEWVQDSGLLVEPPVESTGATGGTGGSPPKPIATVKRNALPEGHNDEWCVSGWLPLTIENKFYALAIARDGYTAGYPAAGSNIDVEVSFHTAKDVVTYTPRAAQIAFLAPFPHHWVSPGTRAENTMMRKISGLEMTGVYLALLFVPFGLWYRRNNIEMWMLISFTLGMMMTYTLVIANLGTLYRLRYGFLMTFVAIGIAGFMMLLENRKAKRATAVEAPAHEPVTVARS